MLGTLCSRDSVDAFDRDSNYAPASEYHGNMEMKTLSTYYEVQAEDVCPTVQHTFCRRFPEMKIFVLRLKSLAVYFAPAESPCSGKQRCSRRPLVVVNKNEGWVLDYSGRPQ